MKSIPVYKFSRFKYGAELLIDVICSIPGEVWTFGEEPKMDALNLIFEKEFLLSFFIDPHFLDQFGYLQSDRSSPFLQADEATLQRLLTLYRSLGFREMKDMMIL